MLAAYLPSESDRCVVIDGAAVVGEHRLQVALLSQVDELPWTLDVPVEAYARADVTPRGAARRMVEIVRFGDVEPALIRAAITAHAGRDLRWGDAPSTCADAFTCIPARARMLDARTVEVTVGEFPADSARGQSPCRELLASSPNALEVSARKSTWGGSIQRSDAWLRIRPFGVERVVKRHYEDAAAAERALDAWRIGSEGSPMVAGMPVEAEFAIEGNNLVQRVRMSWEELALIMEDQARVEALSAQTAPPAVEDESLDLTQLEVVVARVDDRMRALSALSAEERVHAVTSILVLLERALRVHEGDERLSRRTYALQLGERHDARAALAVAESMLKGALLDPASWELLRRAALLQVDKARLRRELARVHHLDAADAARMAASVASAIAKGEDYERAEWAWLTAHTLRARASRMKWFEVPSARVDLGVLVRALSILLSAGGLDGPLGVHLMARGTLAADGGGSGPNDAWSGRVDLGKSKGLVLAATTSSDAELRALGQTLLASFEAGELELELSFSPLSGARTARGPLFRIAGQRGADGFVVERVSSGLVTFDWHALSRLVFDPLTKMSGRLFPPDELIVEASSADEAERVLQTLSSQSDLRCAREGLRLSCRGPLDDSRAAERGLLAVTRVVFERALSGLTSGME